MADSSLEGPIYTCHFRLTTFAVLHDATETTPKKGCPDVGDCIPSENQPLLGGGSKTPNHASGLGGGEKSKVGNTPAITVHASTTNAALFVVKNSQEKILQIEELLSCKISRTERVKIGMHGDDLHEPVKLDTNQPPVA